MPNVKFDFDVYVSTLMQNLTSKPNVEMNKLGSCHEKKEVNTPELRLFRRIKDLISNEHL